MKPFKPVSEVWKYFGIALFTFLLGGGFATLWGRSSIAAVRQEMDERTDYASHKRRAIEDDVEDLEKVNIEILQSLARIEGAMGIVPQK